jgi:hypothetical protein
MSPANTKDLPPDTVFSWVGIIMYLTNDDPKRRKIVTDTFQTKYRDLIEDVGDRNKIVTHWAKQELPPKGSKDYKERLEKLRKRLRERYPVDQFMQLRRLFDPKNLCGNELVDELFGQ